MITSLGHLQCPTTMSGMFARAASFNQPIRKWDVSKVENMRYMFGCAASFNEPLGNWNVSNVTNISNHVHFCYII